MSQTKQLPVASADNIRIARTLHGEGQIRAETRNDDQRSVEIIFAAGAKVKRYAYGEGWYMEELSMDPKHIRLDRFAAGMSLLDSHDAWSMDSRIGTVLPGSVRIAGGKAYCTVKISRNAKGEALWQDLVDGHPFPVSVGYRTHAYEKIEGDDGAIPTLRAIDWEPQEVSAVPVPADGGAHSRAEADDLPISVPIRRGNSMSQITETHEPKDEPPPPSRQVQRAASRVKPKAHARRAFAERHEIRGADLETFVAETEGMTEPEVRSAVLDKMVDIQERTATFPHVSMQVFDRDAGRGDLDAMADALVARLRPGHKMTERAREYAGLDLPGLAAETLRAGHVNTRGMSRNRIVETALDTRGVHTTSDFSIVLGTAVRTTILLDYQSHQATIKAAFGRNIVNDFREIKKAQIGRHPELLPVNEHGEFRRGTVIGESAEGYKIGTFGRIFGVTRQLLINDELGAIDRVIRTAAGAATELENTIMIGLIERASPMSDGRLPFHVDHLNLAASGSTLNFPALEAAILAVEKQRGVDGRLIYQSPRFLVVPSELRIAGRRLLAEIQATKTEDVNPLSSALDLIVEPRLSDPLAWYVVANPSVHDGVEYALLAGNEAPFTDSRSGFDVDGVEFKIRHDFGGGWTDFRGWFKNPGHVIS